MVVEPRSTIEGTVTNEGGEEIELDGIKIEIVKDGYDVYDEETDEKLCHLSGGLIKYLEFIMR